MAKIMLALICVFVAQFSFAQMRSTSKRKPLNFQADKNNLQVLPQRFEYTLLDEDRLKIGDILIDTTQVIFQLEPSNELQSSYRIQFSWPAGLISEGQLTIKNNSGKAIFNKLITKEVLKISKGPTENLPEGLRSDIATFSVDGITPELIEDMKYYPFMTFCIYRESEETKLYLCSKELYLSTLDGKMIIKRRSSAKKTAQIEINRKVVGHQGIIYLNDRNESVAFKLETQTGAFLEIETRMKDVDFKDVVIANDNENIILTASGAEPVDESKVKKISTTEWQITLPKSRPVLYLKGDGDIPMRQEFYVRGTIPSAKNRPYLTSKSPSYTYSSEVTFNGTSPEGVQVKIPDDDLDSKIELLKKNQFQWIFHNIQFGKKTRRYLSVTTENQEFLAGYDIYRGQPFSFGLGANYLIPSGIAYGSLNFQWWFENFLGINSNWSRFHWGLSLDRDQHLLEKDDVTKVDFSTFEILWRAKEGLNLVDETWGLSLPIQMVQGESGSALSFGLGAFLIKKTSNWLKHFMHWSDLKLLYFISSSGSDFKVKSGIHIKAMALWQVSSLWYLNYGCNFSDYKYDPASPTEELQIGLNLGLQYKF